MAWLMVVVVALLASARCAPGAEPPASVAPAPPSAPSTRADDPPVDVLAARGQLLSVKQDWPQAEEVFRAALDKDAERGDVWRGLGYVLRKQGRTSDALQAYERATSLAPNDPDALLGLGECYVALGRKEDAAALVERLRDLDKRHAATLHHVIEAGKPR
jgi:Flp pilus assembly protein TadD